MSRAFDAITRVRDNTGFRSLQPLDEVKEKIKLKEPFLDEEVKKLLQKIENLLKKIDDVERKLRNSENYLTNYGELQGLEKGFLNLYIEFEKIKLVDLEEIPASLINRVKFRKELIDRKQLRRR